MSYVQERRGTAKNMAESLQRRAELYRQFIPDWPALWQSLEREAKAVLAGTQKPRPW